MKKSKDLKEFNTSELFEELNRRGYCKSPIIDLEFVKCAFRDFEAKHELEIDLNEKDLIKLADSILGSDIVRSSIKLELAFGFRQKITKIIEEGLI